MPSQKRAFMRSLREQTTGSIKNSVTDKIIVAVSAKDDEIVTR